MAEATATAEPVDMPDVRPTALNTMGTIPDWPAPIRAYPARLAAAQGEKSASRMPEVATTARRRMSA